MASCSCSSSLVLTELIIFFPRTSSRHQIFLSKDSPHRNFLYRNYPMGNLSRRNGIRTGKEDGNVVVREKRESAVIKDLNGLELNGNGAAGSNGSSVNANGVNGYTDGSLVKYVNGNVGVAVEVVREVREEKVDKEDERKKKAEEIGKEEAVGGRIHIEQLLFPLC